MLMGGGGARDSSAAAVGGTPIGAVGRDMARQGHRGRCAAGSRRGRGRGHVGGRSACGWAVYEMCEKVRLKET
jgi:hypothetical protein